MKCLFILIAILSAGCANGSPLDIIIPARKPSAASVEYLGHMYTTNAVNGLYYTVSDAKLNKALVPIRKMELQGLYFAAKGETEILEMMGSALSNGIWAGVTALLVGAGVMVPRPREGKKVAEALYKDPPK